MKSVKNYNLTNAGKYFASYSMSILDFYYSVNIEGGGFRNVTNHQNVSLKLIV